jgi:predicted transcriptional regulator
MEYLADGEKRTQTEIQKATGLSKQEVSNVMCRHVPSGKIAKFKSGNVTRYAHAKGAQKRKEQIFAEIAACLTGQTETKSCDVAAELGMTTGQAAVYLGQMQELGMVNRRKTTYGKVSYWGLAQ